MEVHGCVVANRISRTWSFLVTNKLSVPLTSCAVLGCLVTPGNWY